MAKTKTPKYRFDGVKDGHYVRAWKEGREWAVQVWKNKAKPEGEPDGDWAMPGVFSLDTAVVQAVLQT